MVIYDNDCYTYKYYNENNEHELLDDDKLTCIKAAEIIHDLMLCKDFIFDQTILNSLDMAMWKLRGNLNIAEKQSN